MRRFQFRLRSLTRLVASRERIERIEVARSVRDAIEAQDQADAAAAGVERARADGTQILGAGSVAPRRMLASLDRLQAAERLRDDADVTSAERERAADGARAGLDAVRRERRSLEKLETRRRTSHERDAQRIDERELDDRACRHKGERR